MKNVDASLNSLKIKKQTERKNPKKYFLIFFFLIIFQSSTYFLTASIIKDSSMPKYINAAKSEHDNGHWIRILNLGIGNGKGFPCLESLKWLVLIYFSWFFYVYLISPFLIYKYLDKNTEKQLLISFLIVLIISFIIFFVFPVEVLIKFQEGWKKSDQTNVIDYCLKQIYELDKNNRFNSLPSFHVVLSWFCYIGFHKKQTKPISQKLILGKLIFCLLVFISTFAIQQHYIMDGIVAIVLVETVFFCVGKRMIKKENLIDKKNSRINKNGKI